MVYQKGISILRTDENQGPLDLYGFYSASTELFLL